MVQTVNRRQQFSACSDRPPRTTSTTRRTACRMKVRRLVRRQADVTAAVAFQTPAAVESRSPAADQFQLTQLGAEFMGTRFPDHLPSVLGNPLFLGTIVACGEVGQQPITELGRHADVNQLACTIQHAVHAWRRRARARRRRRTSRCSIVTSSVSNADWPLKVRGRSEPGEQFGRRSCLPQHTVHGQIPRLREHNVPSPQQCSGSCEHRRGSSRFGDPR